MKFDTPAGRNAIDALQVVGHPVERVDGAAKTTGRATYAFEHAGAGPDMAYGWIVGAGIARGRIAAIRDDAARNAPGVLAVVTAGNAGPLHKSKRNTVSLLAGPEISHYHQAVALVVARSLEQARAAAQLLEVDCVRADGDFDLAAASVNAGVAASDGMGGPGQTRVGDFEAAFAKAPVQLDARYSTPDQSHAMMEPHASMAEWTGDALTLHTSTQMVDWAASDLAETLGIPKDKLRIVSPYCGGGFGAKLFLRADALLAALGARAAGCKVKVALPRPLIANNTTHRPATLQRIRIGATADGVIQAIAHESWSGDQPGGAPETAVGQTKLLYAGANRLTALHLAQLHLPEGNSMRAPGEAPGMMALEIAMDEMAEQLGLDPIEFRVRNDTQVDPALPARRFSQRRLVDCMRVGAERFGWTRRNSRPARVRQGDAWIGLGMAAAFRNNMLTPSAARVRLDAQGRLSVETDMTDIGTGSYTVLAQTAAEMMGLPLERVTVRLGDSDFPVSCGSGGQWGGNNATAGVFAACTKLREQVARKLGLDPATAAFRDGHVGPPGAPGVPLTQAVREGEGELVAQDRIEYGELDKSWQQSTFGAHFVEVAVDAYTAEVRVRRMLAVCAAGRILNPRTARSQVIGSMTMGVGAALMEQLQVDTRLGFFVNHDLAGYEVPVHADIPSQEVIFLDEPDPMSSPMKAKGVAELGICGVGAAVANAVYNATGVRVHDYPITLDKLIDGLPPVR